MTLFTVGTLGITQGAYKLATVRRRRSPPIARLRPQELTLSSLLPPSLPPSLLCASSDCATPSITSLDNVHAFDISQGKK